VLTERLAAHILVNRLTIVEKTSGTIWHYASTLSFANGNTQVRFSRFTEYALATFSGVKWNYMITWFDASHAFTNLNYNTSTFMPENSRKNTFRIIARQSKCICMTHTGMGDLD